MRVINGKNQMERRRTKFPTRKSDVIKTHCHPLTPLVAAPFPSIDGIYVSEVDAYLMQLSPELG